MKCLPNIKDMDTFEMKEGGLIIEHNNKIMDSYGQYFGRSFSLNNAKMDIEIYHGSKSEGRYFKILNISVDKSEKRNGYATKLFNKAKEIALTGGFDKIDLLLPTDNLGLKGYTKEDYKIVVAFYTKNGFEFYPNSQVKMFFKT